MKKKIALGLFSLLGLLFFQVAPGFGQGKAADEAQFKKALAGVQAGLDQNAPDKVADWCAFPKFYWETPGLGDDLSRDAFLKNFAKIFTPEIRAKLKAGKFEALPNGDYKVEWNKKNDNFILVFEKQKDGSYKLGGLAVGPADGSG